MSTNACRIVALISGNGSNLQALVDQAANRAYQVAGVVCNNPAAYGLRRAAQAGLPAAVVEHRDYPDRASFDDALLEAIDGFAPDLIALAGFMRILGPAFVRRQAGRILNIHPSLLPKYAGLHTHRRVLEAGDSEHGVSIHFVNEDLDGGPLVARSRIAVRAEDTEQSLQQRAHRLEHVLYPQVVGWYAAGRLRLRADGVYLDSGKLPAAGVEVEIPSHGKPLKSVITKSGKLPAADREVPSPSGA